MVDREKFPQATDLMVNWSRNQLQREETHLPAADSKRPLIIVMEDAE